MYADEVRRMYESGELERLCRMCGVGERHLADFVQEVALRLLTKGEKAHNLQAYTVTLIRKQYYGRKGKWWKEEGRWNAARVELQDARGEIPYEGGEGDF